MRTHFATSEKRNSEDDIGRANRSAVEFGGKTVSKDEIQGANSLPLEFGGKMESKDDISWRNARGWRERMEARKKNRQEDR